jgi:hypothetical protein
MAVDGVTSERVSLHRHARTCPRVFMTALAPIHKRLGHLLPFLHCYDVITESRFVPDVKTRTRQLANDLRRGGLGHRPGELLTGCYVPRGADPAELGPEIDVIADQHVGAAMD